VEPFGQSAVSLGAEVKARQAWRPRAASIVEKTSTPTDGIVINGICGAFFSAATKWQQRFSFEAQ
jgi:hypothetical protein